MLKENKQAYLEQKIEKYAYMEQMFGLHKVLYDYADYIKGSDCLEITLKDGEVIFNFLSCGKQIKMVCLPYDITSVPFTFLDFGGYDREETRFLVEIVKEKDVVLDIGANLGWYTLNWLKTGKKVTVFSFEPLPQIYAKLVQNLTLNGIPRKNAFNFGLADKNEDFDFFFDTKRCGASSMVNLRDTQDTAKVKCTLKRLDDVFPGLKVKKLDLIKCDVEGAEKLVFEGGWETIKKYQPVVFSEILRKWSRKFDYHPNDVLKSFRDIGYDCYVIDNGRIKKLPAVTEETRETNFLFLHGTKHAKLALRLSGGKG